MFEHNFFLWETESLSLERQRVIQTARTPCLQFITNLAFLISSDLSEPCKLKFCMSLFFFF